MIASEEQISGKILDGRIRFSDAWVYWFGNKPERHLLNNLATGLPHSWNLYSPSKDRRENLYVDDIAKPSLLAKVRTPHSPDVLNIKPLDLPDELKLAHNLDLVLRKERAQSIAQRHGYLDVHLIAPICAVKEMNDQKRKFLVFPFIKNAQFLLQEARTPLIRHLEEAGEDLAVGLGEYLSGQGFDNPDFGSHQFLVTRDRLGEHLYVADSEDFRRV